MNNIKDKFIKICLVSISFYLKNALNLYQVKSTGLKHKY